MICVTVTPSSRKLAKVDLLNAARYGDVIELCLDHLSREPDVKDLISAVNKPIIISCRRKEDGGAWEGTEDARLTLLRQAIVAGPAYIELDLDTAPGIPRFGDTKRIISFTRLDQPEHDIDQLAVRRIEIDRFGKFHQGTGAFPEPADAAVWKCDAFVQAGAAESFALHERREHLFIRNIRIGSSQQLAQDFQAMLLAARTDIAEHAVGFDEFFEIHGLDGPET